MGQNQHPGPFLETREQELSFGTLGFKVGQRMLWEIINLEKVRVYSSPTVDWPFYKIDDVLFEHGGLTHALLLVVHLRFSQWSSSLRRTVGNL